MGGLGATAGGVGDEIRANVRQRVVSEGCATHLRQRERRRMELITVLTGEKHTGTGWRRGCAFHVEARGLPSRMAHIPLLLFCLLNRLRKALARRTP